MSPLFGPAQSKGQQGPMEKAHMGATHSPPVRDTGHISPYTKSSTDSLSECWMLNVGLEGCPPFKLLEFQPSASFVTTFVYPVCVCSSWEPKANIKVILGRLVGRWGGGQLEKSRIGQSWNLAEEYMSVGGYFSFWAKMKVDYLGFSVESVKLFTTKHQMCSI